MLKFNVKLFVHPPPKKKMTMAHLSPSVDMDRRPWKQPIQNAAPNKTMFASISGQKALACSLSNRFGADVRRTLTEY